MNKTSWLLAALLTTAASTARADAPEYWLDDAETEFGIQNTYDTANGVQFNPGWSLKVSWVLRGNPKRSAGSVIKFAIKQGKVTAETVCNIGDQRTDYAYDTCYDPKQQLKLTGDVEVTATYVDGKTDAVTPLRTYKLKVMTATQIRGNLAPAASQQYVSWNARPLETFMRPGGQNVIEMLVRFSPPYETGAPSMLDTSLACSVNGKLLDDPSFQWLNSAAKRSLSEQVIARAYEDKKLSKNEYLKSSGTLIRWPMTYGPEDKRFKGMWVLDDLPGKWECKWKSKGKLMRTFRFEVADGKLVPHPEQKAGLNIPEDTIFVEMEISPDSPLDEVLVPDELQKGAFFGRGWLTPEGKKMAAAVKAKGRAHFPQPKALDFGKPIKAWAFGK